MTTTCANLPFIPTIAVGLIKELCDGKTLKREAIIEIIFSEHLRRNGKGSTQKPWAVVKKALTTLKEQGYAVNVAFSTGWWKLGVVESDDVGVDKPSALKLTGCEPVNPDANSENKDREKQVMPSKIPQTLYVYYFANYKDCAILKGENKWKCKIGFTRCDVQARIAEQLGTGSPEKPVIALQVETHDAKTLETTVHGILKLRGRYDEEAHGCEWFITNPEEVKEICNFVMKK